MHLSLTSSENDVNHVQLLGQIDRFALYYFKVSSEARGIHFFCLHMIYYYYYFFKVSISLDMHFMIDQGTQNLL